MKAPMIIIFLLAAICPIGCASGGLQNINDDYDIGKQQNRAIIIGKATLKYENFIGIPTYRVIYISKLQQMKDQKQWILIRASGDFFFISLEAGDYIVTGARLGFGLSAAVGKSYPAELSYIFRADPGEIIYIGNLTVQYKAHEGAGSEPTGPSQFETSSFNSQPTGNFQFETSSFITDDFENASNEFNKKYPNVKVQIKKGLMNYHVFDSTGLTEHAK
jgi:hypothetical protein